MDARELRQIFEWAESCTKNEDFWERVLLASKAYSLEIQLRIAALARLALEIE